MKISIAMATYNGDKYLPEQLQSFLDQNRQPDELVVSDDGSTDRTLEIVEEFARIAPFEVRYSRNIQNLGYASNFNAVLMKTSGDLVFLSDQDDVWFPEKIRQIEALAEKHPDRLVIMNDAALTDAGLNEVGLTKLGQIHSAGLPDQSFVMGCCCAVRRKLLDLCLPIPADYKTHDDWIVSFAEGLEAKLISSRVLQYYRRHDNNKSLFIANRTTKITSWDLHKELVRRACQPASEADELASLQQIRLQLEGIARALSRDRGEYAHLLQTMESQGRTVLGMREKRIKIRRKRLPVRLVASLAFWLAGGYRQAHGFRSVVRDLLG